MLSNNYFRLNRYKTKKTISRDEQLTNGYLPILKWSNYFLLIAFLSLSCKKNHDSFPPAQEIPQFNVLYGGSGGDVIYSIIKSLDTGYIAVGDRDSSHGLLDVWVLKLDNYGNVVWQKTFGGTSFDVAHSIIKTKDVNYLIAGFTNSNEGDVTGNHGLSDVWLIELDKNGNLIWQKTLGGPCSDVAYSIIASSDGGYIMVGETCSNDGDVSGNHGNYDGWLVKLDKDGNILWQKSWGGSNEDGAYSVAETPDNSIVVAGYTMSNNYDASGFHGVEDGWVVKFDQDGNQLWRKILGGSNPDVFNSITTTPDGNILLAGGTRSNDGDASGNHGNGDVWIVELDKDGNILWQKELGGSGWDMANCITLSSNGDCLIAALTQSNDGDVSGFHGGTNSDAWVVKLDKHGNKLWQKVVGGSGEDDINSIIVSQVGNYVAAGITTSNDGDVSHNHGGVDGWVFTLKDQ